MTAIDDILRISSGGGFEEAALELFGFQAAACGPYRDYLYAVGVNPDGVRHVEDIPYLPISFFKTHDVYCAQTAPEIVFTSSTTGGGVPARHAFARRSDYERVFTEGFRRFYGDPSAWTIYALLPSYLEREGSSLVYMADHLIRLSNAERLSASGGFYLNEYEKLIEDIAADPGPKILLGVSYALLDLAGEFPRRLENTVVMETGGMKGRREEMSKDAFHSVLKGAFGLETTHSEYGMAELCSQAYSAGNGVFRTPPWMKVFARDLNDPFDILPFGRPGGLNIIDLGNIHSCCFIQTEDIGTVFADGSFTVAGRADRSEIRGCNLLVE